MSKKILSLLLVLVMMVSLFAATSVAYADDEEVVEEHTTEPEKPEEEETEEKEAEETGVLIKFDAGEGTVDISNMYTDKNGKLPKFPNVTPPEGKVFSHWEDDDKNVVTLDTVFTSMTVVRAQYYTIYTVTFDANGGTNSVPSAQTDSNGKIASLPVPTAPAGKEFAGWFTEKDGGTQVTLDKVYTENTTVYAHYGDINYAITVNGGKADKVKAPGGATVTITADTAPAGTKFDKWTVDEGGAVLADPTQAVTTFTMTNANVMVTANFVELSYKIIAGDGGAWAKSSGKTLSFTCDGPYANFTGLLIDGKVLPITNYTAKSGSTIVELKSEYLETLTLTGHKIKFVYNIEGIELYSNEGTFTVNAANGVPSTGDHFNGIAVSALLLMGCTGLAVVTWRRKKAENG